jgi:hypothetical protein
MVHGRIEFEGKSAAELQDNPMIKRYYLPPPRCLTAEIRTFKRNTIMEADDAII